MSFFTRLLRRKPGLPRATVSRELIEPHDLPDATGIVIGIHPDLCGDESYSDKWIEWFTSRGVKVKVLDLLAEDAMRQASRCDGVMWRWIHSWQFKQSAQRILSAVEHGLSRPVFPDTPTAWHYDEKVSQAFLLDALGVETPKTWVFWDKAKALAWAKTAPYPVVFKLSVGAGSSNVLLVCGLDDAVSLIERMFSGGIFPYTMNEFKTETPGPRTPLWKSEFDYAYFQEFVPDNDYDTRITVIGDRAFGFLRHNRPGDFRASGRGKIDYDMDHVDPRCVEMALALSKKCGWQAMAFDFLFKDGRPVVNEVSYTFFDRAVERCPGHWLSDGTLVMGHLWPQDAIAEDFIRLVASRKGLSSR